MIRTVLSGIWIFAAVAMTSQVRADSEMEGMRLFCSGTWGARAWLSGDESKFVLRSPGRQVITYAVVDRVLGETGTTYLADGAELTIGIPSNQGSFFVQAEEGQWLLNFGCGEMETDSGEAEVFGSNVF